MFLDMRLRKIFTTKMKEKTIRISCMTNAQMVHFITAQNKRVKTVSTLEVQWIGFEVRFLQIFPSEILHRNPQEKYIDRIQTIFYRTGISEYS